MKTTIISWSADQADTLRQNALNQGYDVVQTLLRDDSTQLRDLLELVAGDVLIVDSSGAHQTQDMAELTVFTARQAGLEVLLLTDQRSAELMVAAMQAGVREVLLMPPSASDFAEALRRLSLRKKAAPPEPKQRAKRVAFLSCKGGSGATFLATNFASLLAHNLGRNTLFLDLDLQCGDAVYYVSPGPSKSNITEITRQIERLDTKLLASSVLHVAPNFDLLSAPEEPEASYAMSPAQLERLVDIASLNYDMVVMDLDRVITPLTTQALDMADVVYVVMENLLPFLRDAKRLVAKCRALGYDDHKLRLIVNRYERSDIIDVAQIEKVVGLKVSHTIASSFQDVAQAINTGVPILQVNASNPIIETLQTMAQEFELTKPTKRGSWINRLMGS
jgi:pilus assembly protein CpaE